MADRALTRRDVDDADDRKKVFDEKSSKNFIFPRKPVEAHFRPRQEERLEQLKQRCIFIQKKTSDQISGVSCSSENLSQTEEAKEVKNNGAALTFPKEHLLER